MQVGFIFPGQGSQVVGMGRELAEHFPAAREVFQTADKALGFSLTKICWEGPEEELKATSVTQPAIVATSVACMGVFQDVGVKPAMTAGHSVGEYAALVCAGAMDLADAIRLTRLRGQLMETSCPNGLGGMAAIIGFDRKRVLEICKEVADAGVAEPAGYNCPDQVVIAGHIRAISEVIARAKAEGAGNATMLPVSGPFHSSLMKAAEEGLARTLEKTSVRKAKLPVVCNVDAQAHTEPAQLKRNLLAQLTQPVRWEESIAAMRAAGVRVFVELGAGRVLAGLLKRIDRSLDTKGVRDLASLEKTIDDFKANTDIPVTYTRPATAS